MSWTKDEALRAAQDHLQRHYSLGEDGIAFLNSLTRELPYGWLFFYDSRRFVETGDVMHALGGNGPLVAMAESERIFELGTVDSVDHELLKLEAREGLRR